ncbi:MAG TPA: hypothetical protein VGI96_11505 [Streptosporangiaceae bacterium]
MAGGQPVERRQRRRGRADAEQQADAVRVQPPPDEGENFEGLPVQPLSVIDEPDQRLPGGHLRKQCQHAEADQEPVRRRTGRQAERRTQRITLRSRQPDDLIQEWHHHAVQRGKTEPQL